MYQAAFDITWPNMTLQVGMLAKRYNKDITNVDVLKLDPSYLTHATILLNKSKESNKVFT
jgi:hypothetical protein